MKLVLWDKAEKCKFRDNRILYWNDSSFPEKPLSESNTNLENHSLNNYVEHHSENIRNDFLDWVNKLSSVKINNKKFKDLIKLENDFSYWNLCEFNLKEGLKYDGDPMSILELKKRIKSSFSLC